MSDISSCNSAATSGATAINHYSNTTTNNNNQNNSLHEQHQQILKSIHNPYTSNRHTHTHSVCIEKIIYIYTTWTFNIRDAILCAHLISLG